MKRPNILIFNPDQMRSDALHHLGNAASITPRLDAFAHEDAVSFRNAFCQNTVCVPSRCSFLTGLYPHVGGHRTMNHMLHGDEPSLFSELKDAGYYVWLNDRNDFLPAQDEGYYDRHAEYVYKDHNNFITPRMKTSHPRGEYGNKDFYSFYRGRIEVPDGVEYKQSDDYAIDAALEFLTTRKTDAEQPFCLFLGLIFPHPPYQVEEPYYSSIDRSLLPPRIASFGDGGMPSMLDIIRREQMITSYSENDWDELRATYLGMCMKVDHQFGLICDALKQAGLYDDTDIYFFSDHGDFTGDYGITEKSQNTFEDCLVKVPFLVKPHKGVSIDPGISDSLVELVDFYGTAVDLSGIESSHTHFGKSLRNILGDRMKEIRDFTSCEGGRLAEENHCSEIPKGVPGANYEYRPRMIAQHDPIAHTKATMIRTKDFKYVKRLYESDEFYNLNNDPLELHNLVNDAGHKEVLIDLKERMLTWYQETSDIVPFAMDSRFNIQELWSSMKANPVFSDVETVEIEKRIQDKSLFGAEFTALMARYRNLREKEMEKANTKL